MKTNLLKTFFVALCLITATGASAHDFYVDGIYYYITDATAKTVEVTYKGGSEDEYDNEYIGSVVIPSMVTYNNAAYSVTSIGYRAFQNCSGLTGIAIPNSVTSIEFCAFQNCTGLTSITIPNSVTSIGNCAFYECSGLMSVTIGNSVTSIGNYAFYDCDGLTSITIPNSVTSIGFAAFYGCSGLTGVTIGNSVTSIGEDAFYACTNLTAVHINDLAAWCKIDFSNYSSNPLYYAHNLYLNGEKVTNLVIPDGVTEIKDYAFEGCTGLTSITIPNSVTSIGEDAFEGCTGLTSITIPNSVTSIGAWAFYDCTSLKTVYNFSSLELTKGYTNNGSVAYYADKVINAPNGSVEGDYVFSVVDGVNTLCGYIGNGREITLPADYKGENYVIGADVFKNNTALIAVHISDLAAWCKMDFSNYYSNPLYYAHNLYLNGEKVTNLVIPDGVTEIKYSAFIGCRGLTSVTIPNSITSIGYSAFSGCTGLTAVHISDLAAWCKMDFSNYYSNPLYYAHNLYLNGEKVTNFVIPDGVTEIKKYAFEGCTGLTSVTIPNSVTSIGNEAFGGCNNLSTIVVDSNNPHYDSREDCNAIIETATNTLVVGCYNTVIPNGIESISARAFQDCTGLTNIKIPNSVTSIEENAFYNCTGLKKVELSCSKIENWFSNNSSIEEVVIDDNTTEISNSAFTGCTNLKTITIGKNVKAVRESAFESCNALETIYAMGEKPALVGDNNFTFDQYLNVKLYVPVDFISKYQTAEVWENFWEIEGIDSTTGIEDIETEHVKGIYYNLKGQRVIDTDNLTRGFYIINGKKVYVR